MLSKHISGAILSKDLYAIDLAENLQVIARYNLSTEVQLVFQLVIKHGQDTFLKLFEFLFDLFVCGLRFQFQLLGQEHRADSLGHRSYSLIKVGKELIELREVSLHVHSVVVERLLSTITDVHHLHHC